MGLEDTLINLKGLTPWILVTLGEKKILTVDSDYVTVEKVINELNRIRYSLPERPSLQEAIKKGMHQSVLQKFEQEMLLNSEAKSLKLNVPMVVKTKAIREENAFKDPLGKFSQNKFTQTLKMQAFQKQNI